RLCRTLCVCRRARRRACRARRSSRFPARRLRRSVDERDRATRAKIAFAKAVRSDHAPRPLVSGARLSHGNRRGPAASETGALQLSAEVARLPEVALKEMLMARMVQCI